MEAYLGELGCVAVCCDESSQALSAVFVREDFHSSHRADPNGIERRFATDIKA